MRRMQVTPLQSCSAGPLRGRVRLPGDKSISHRALMVGGVAVGATTIYGLLESEDVMRTAAALRAMGVEIGSLKDPEGNHDCGVLWRVHGVGVGGLAEPSDVLNMGNSGTGARLLMGLLATHPFTSFLTGDSSLRRRPMARVAEPLRLMGAAILSSMDCRLPLALTGSRDPVPIVYTLPVPSAQVKSAVLLAALNTAGETTVIEPRPTRDHSERMLKHFGADIRSENLRDGGRAVTLVGEPELSGRTIHVPGDPSSAGFSAVAALILPDSEITLEGVGVNPLRLGLYDSLREMGADITFSNPRSEAGEPVADITVRSSVLKGIEVPEERAPSMIDEYPILAVAAAFAEGKTTLRGLSELRVKESDRISVMANALAACGVTVEEREDGLIVYGQGGVTGGKRGRTRGRPKGGVRIATHLDHRVAMSFLVLGMAAAEPVCIDDGAIIATSFPDFAGFMNHLGAAITEAPD